ncbi:recombination protein RecO [Helicobacter sp. MIT 99-5507]|uniref:recombination protein RecO n=1 Tax=Helicobacter sp. MIT 99-5507 TaxID=152489 RepID=UPI0015F1BE7A|nr:recombination protein RecO [Helicobacter sp. MIT 99-5507]
MQGFISGITKLKNEDIIVQIITQNKFLSLYRFYGLRHSIISIGRKIDFDIEYNGQFIPKLRNIIQLGFAYESDFTKLYYWQQFLKLLNNHLRDTEDIPSFYFEMLNNGAIILNKQNPSRVLIEMYVKLLHFEGRLSLDSNCFICNEELSNKIAVTRGFLCAHNSCLINNIEVIDKDLFFGFIKLKKSIFLNDSEVEYLLNALLLGI